MVSRVDKLKSKVQLPKSTAMPYRLVMARNNKSKRSVVEQGCLPLDLVSLWISPDFGSRKPLLWTVRLSFPTPLASYSLHVLSSNLIIKRMSSLSTAPTEFLDEFRTTLHRDFSYDPFGWRDNLVLESREGVRFDFSSQILIIASAFFVGAPVSLPAEHEEPVPGDDRLQPIPLTFDSSPSLRYLLIVLRQTSGIRNVKPLSLASMGNARQEPPWEITIESVRVAEILDAPSLAETSLKRSRLDVFYDE
jgi:hypothetical protein